MAARGLRAKEILGIGPKSGLAAVALSGCLFAGEKDVTVRAAPWGQFGGDLLDVAQMPRPDDDLLALGHVLQELA